MDSSDSIPNLLQGPSKGKPRTNRERRTERDDKRKAGFRKEQGRKIVDAFRAKLEEQYSMGAIFKSYISF